MKIIGKRFGEDVALLKSLQEQGLKAKMVKGAIIVDDVDEKTPEIQDMVLFIDASENGGGMTNSGCSGIICGLKGEKLKPYYIPKGYSNGTHAYFCQNELVVVSGDKSDGLVEINNYKIVGREIVAENIWSGEPEWLPDTYNCFADAVSAAMQKANCYHCRCVHYAVM